MPTITFEPYAPGITATDGQRAGSIDPRLSRTNYYDGQLLKASDLTRDQIYLDERLLEMGQVLGSGIAQGLDLKLVDNHLLQVQPGIAITPSGRVLQLTDRVLEINLQDSGVIADLNQGLYRRFQRGLYAVALRYAEVVDGVSESYPSSLSSRQWRVSSYAEGVELALLPLNLTLPRGDALAIRASLAQQIIGLGGVIDLPSDEAVALGLVAIDQARPLWLDLGLLRRPLRRQQLSNALQLNLATHYQELFAEVLAVRHETRRQEDFPALNYFRLLPPYGPLPKGAVDPVTGRQSYFPKDYDVSIAPVRRADLATLIAESALLAPMDLERDADADIMVLVPLSDPSFAMRARQLEQPQGQSTAAFRSLRQFSGLTLRFTPLAPVHKTDTDADVWREIWKEARQEELIYVRRPPRTAETNVSAVVLAQGFQLPALDQPMPMDTAELEQQLDEALETSEQVQAELAQGKAEIQSLKQQISLLQEIVDNDLELIEAQDRINALKTEIEAAKAQLAALQDQAKDAATFKTALAAATEKIAALTAELELAYQRIAKLETSVVVDPASQSKIAELTQNLQLAQQQIRDLRNELDTLTVKKAEAEARLLQATNQIEELRKKLDELSSTASSSDSELQARITTLTDKLTQLDSQLQGLQGELNQAKTALAAAEQANRDLNARLGTALTQIETVQKERDGLKSALDTAKAALESCKAAQAVGATTVSGLYETISHLSALKEAFALTPLAATRGGDTAIARELDDISANDSTILLAMLQLVTATPVRYDKALWPSLLSVANKPTTLPALRDEVFALLRKSADIAPVYLKVGADFGMTDKDLELWKSLSA